MTVDCTYGLNPQQAEAVINTEGPDADYGRRRQRQNQSAYLPRGQLLQKAYARTAFWQLPLPTSCRRNARARK